MTPRQIALIRQSWVNVQPVADQAAKLFYDRLFEVRPDLRPMFSGDMLEAWLAFYRRLAARMQAGGYR